MMGMHDTKEEIMEEATNFALMAFTLDPSNSNSKLDEALREKEDLKAKLEKFETSFKNLTKLLNSQISAKVKTVLGYDSQFNENEVLDVKEDEVTETVFDNRSSDEGNSLANDRFKKDRMAKKSLLPNNVGKRTSHRETRLGWNHVQRINHQNKFAPPAVFTRFGRIPVSAAKPKVAASTSAAKPVNTTGPKQSVKFSNIRSTFHKSHSPIRRSFYNATAHSISNSTERVNTAGSKAVYVVKGNEVTDVKALVVIKNGNKVLKRTVRTVKQIYEPTSLEEKLDRKNEMKARGNLLMALLNKDQLKFHSYQDAKLLMEAIKKRYGGNKESKKVQRTLLKQQYENFAASSSETLDQTFDRFQNLLVSWKFKVKLLSKRILT
nr:ribonuclease H-like domain-containing protein [Tanacetum cinerariifolium]